MPNGGSGEPPLPSQIRVKGGSKNDYGVADSDQVFDAGCVPVRQANATAAGGAADCFRIVCAMNSNAGLV